MAARIRLKRIGRKNRPSYRICVFDARTRRDGAPIEELGSYDPQGKSIDDKVKLDKERALHWLSVGAQPSEKVQALLNKHGVKKPAPGEPWALPESAPAAPPTAPAASPAAPAAPPSSSPEP